MPQWRRALSGKGECWWKTKWVQRPNAIAPDDLFPGWKNLHRTTSGVKLNRAIIEQPTDQRVAGEQQAPAAVAEQTGPAAVPGAAPPAEPDAVPGDEGAPGWVPVAVGDLLATSGHGFKKEN